MLMGQPRTLIIFFSFYFLLFLPFCLFPASTSQIVPCGVCFMQVCRLFFSIFFNYLSAENWSMSKRVKQRPMLYPFHCWAAIIKYSGVDVACREQKMTETCIAVSLLLQCISIIKKSYLFNLYRKVQILCDSK